MIILDLRILFTFNGVGSCLSVLATFLLFGTGCSRHDIHQLTPPFPHFLSFNPHFGEGYSPLPGPLCMCPSLYPPLSHGSFSSPLSYSCPTTPPPPDAAPGYSNFGGSCWCGHSLSVPAHSHHLYLLLACSSVSHACAIHNTHIHIIMIPYSENICKQVRQMVEHSNVSV